MGIILIALITATSSNLSNFLRKNSRATERGSKTRGYVHFEVFNALLSTKLWHLISHEMNEKDFLCEFKQRRLMSNNFYAEGLIMTLIVQLFSNESFSPCFRIKLLTKWEGFFWLMEISSDFSLTAQNIFIKSC